MRILLALVAVTAVWGVTFKQVKDAVELYPLFAFLALRFVIASATLAPFALPRLTGRTLLPGALLGTFLGVGYGFQTAGLELTTVAGTGFVTGLYVVLTPLLAFALFRDPVGAAGWLGVGLAFLGMLMLSGVEAGSSTGNLLVLVGAASFAFQIAVTPRFAPHHDALALTFVQMVTCAVGFTAVAAARGEFETPHGWTVWGALVVTGVFASALAYLVQTWAQRRTSATRTAVIYSLEPVFAGLAGYALAGDRLGPLGWGGCAVILGGILLAEPAAASALRRLVRRDPVQLPAKSD